MAEASKSGGALLRPGTSYAFAIGLVALVLLLRSAIAPTIDNQALYLFLTPSVLIAGIVGGLGPGLFATFLALVLHLSITGEYANLANPRSPLFVSELARAGTFVLLGAGIAWFGERLRIARTQAIAGTQNALAREAHVQSILDTGIVSRIDCTWASRARAF